MTDPNRYPDPIYAAAGVGDLAYRQLRKLPTVVTELTDKAAASGAELREKAAAMRASELREKAATRAAELREKAAARLRTAGSAAAELRDRAADGELDMDRLRAAAARNAAAVKAGAQAAQERAASVYGALVARGERIVGRGVVPAGTTINADMEATEAPAEVTAGPAASAPSAAEK